MPDVDYSYADDVARLVLNRPMSLNAINRGMHDGIVGGLRRAMDDGARAVVLSGKGTSFSAGGDLKAVAAGENVGDPRDLAKALVATTMPVIAAVHGYCLGQAFELVQCCDLAVASDDARFGEVEIRHGWTPPVPITARVLARKHAMETLLLGEVFDATTALRMGIVNRVVATDLLESEIQQLTAQLCVLDPRVVAANKSLVNSVWRASGAARRGAAFGEGWLDD